MKTPGFWFRPPGLLCRLLTPLGRAYHSLATLKKPYAAKASTPLIVVGNVVAGGAGKTPVVISLAQHLLARGLKVHLIAKGYGGRLKAPTRVEGHHTSVDVGDEPLLLAQIAPTFIGADRGATYMLAAQEADVVISDDGMQSLRLIANLTLLVIDGVLGFGNGRLIPAGPLREPVNEALARCDAVIQIGSADRPYGDKPVLLADFMPFDPDWLRGAQVVAFAGIGQPEKFFASLTTCGARLIASHAFADHHPFTEGELKALLQEADAHNAMLVTTAKDYVRLPQGLAQQARVLNGSLVWRTPDKLSSLLDGFLKAYKAA